MKEFPARIRLNHIVADITMIFWSFFIHGLVNFFTDTRASIYFWRKIGHSLCHASLSAHKKIETPLALPQRNVNEVIPGIDSVPIMLVDYKREYGEMPLHELLVLCQLIRTNNPKNIFEIGTYLGGTTLQMAANSDATIFTLDLAQGDRKNFIDSGLDVFPKSPGIKFLNNRVYAGRIKQLIGNSQTYDFKPFNKKFDFILVDGCHHYDHVIRDSRNALNMKSENGIVVWHDYADYAPGVVKALEEIRDSRFVHFSDTSLVCCI